MGGGFRRADVDSSARRRRRRLTDEQADLRFWCAGCALPDSQVSELKKVAQVFGPVVAGTEPGDFGESRRMGKGGGSYRRTRNEGPPALLFFSPRSFA